MEICIRWPLCFLLNYVRLFICLVVKAVDRSVRKTSSAANTISIKSWNIWFQTLTPSITHSSLRKWFKQMDCLRKLISRHRYLKTHRVETFWTAADGITSLLSTHLLLLLLCFYKTKENICSNRTMSKLYIEHIFTTNWNSIGGMFCQLLAMLTSFFWTSCNHISFTVMRLILFYFIEQCFIFLYKYS